MKKTDLETYASEIKDLKEAYEDLKAGSDLSALKDQILAYQTRLTDPSIWGKPQEMAALQKDLSDLEKKEEDRQHLEELFAEVDAALELLEEEFDPGLAQDFLALWKSMREAFRTYKLGTLFRGPHDASGAIVTLHSGAGGTEAQDWTEMLLRMYSRFAEQKDLRLVVTDEVPGEEAGLKSVSFLVQGQHAFGLLRSEHGVHRLVRISPFDSSGRRHTSFASLEVIPEIDDDVEIEVRPEDLRVDTYRSSGAGGQHVNKTSSAVRMTHLPTGIVVSCQNERSQIMNRETAMKMLKSKLYDRARKEKEEKIRALKGEQFANAWSSQIRSYVFCPYRMVKDHRTDYETADVEGVMDGDLDEFIIQYLLWSNRQDQV